MLENSVTASLPDVEGLAVSRVDQSVHIPVQTVSDSNGKFIPLHYVTPSLRPKRVARRPLLVKHIIIHGPLAVQVGAEVEVRYGSELFGDGRQSQSAVSARDMALLEGGFIVLDLGLFVVGAPALAVFADPVAPQFGAWRRRRFSRSRLGRAPVWAGLCVSVRVPGLVR